ncbi:MAG TPA: gluconate 2-dehydrogenase subunit 3 family protein [Bryobacteraceae bacterium]|nr:gluconate 2-dehydrogenase subunit 3 family protein [Bryobacteraceae bacterium]
MIPVQIGDFSRRELLKRVAMAVVAMEAIPLADAQEVHSHAIQEKSRTGAYKPKLFNKHEYETITRLAELIVPADQVSGSAVDAGAPEFIDLLASHNEKLADICTGGIGWIDTFARTLYQTTFVEARAERQIALLEQLVRARTQSEGSGSGPREPRNPGAREAINLSPGVTFFNWISRMAIDAFYTSPIGMKDLGYMGNSATSAYSVPQESIDYAFKRSPFS